MRHGDVCRLKERKGRRSPQQMLKPFDLVDFINLMRREIDEDVQSRAVDAQYRGKQNTREEKRLLIDK
jgi:hypothetical protein